MRHRLLDPAQALRRSLEPAVSHSGDRGPAADPTGSTGSTRARPATRPARPSTGQGSHRQPSRGRQRPAERPARQPRARQQIHRLDQAAAEGRQQPGPARPGSSRQQQLDQDDRGPAADPTGSTGSTRARPATRPARPSTGQGSHRQPSRGRQRPAERPARQPRARQQIHRLDQAAAEGRQQPGPARPGSTEGWQQRLDRAAAARPGSTGQRLNQARSDPLSSSTRPRAGSHSTSSTSRGRQPWTHVRSAADLSPPVTNERGANSTENAPRNDPGAPPDPENGPFACPFCEVVKTRGTGGQQVVKKLDHENRRADLRRRHRWSSWSRWSGKKTALQ